MFVVALLVHMFIEKEDSQLATIVIRGSTDNLMDDMERAVDDGVNTFKALTKDNRLVPGAGASEIELAKQIISYGEVSLKIMSTVTVVVVEG